MTEPAAVVFEERRFSLPQLDALADGWAATLAKNGVTAGQRVAVMASNRPEFVAVMLGIWRLAATAVLISPAWKRDEVDHALALTEPAHAVGDHPVLAGVMPMLHLDEPIAPGSRLPGRNRRRPTRCWCSVPAPPGCRRPSGTPTRRWMRPCGIGGRRCG